MKIDILTLFPEMITGMINTSIIKKAIANGLVEINLINFRDFSKDKHKRVDDYQIGGGSGMILMPEPIYLAVESLKNKNSKVILMTPQGNNYNQEMAISLKKETHLIIICGHYEGFDERIRELVDIEVSIGDYILTGGEIPAMAIVDSVVRLLDGAIDIGSCQSESFNDNLLDYPVYTKPNNFRGMKVPEILLSGHHQKIAKWRLEKRIEKTKQRRPDLWKKRDLDEK